MRELHISPSSLSGEIFIPPSKSHSIRALLFAMMGSGTSRLENLLPSPDIEAMVEALRLFGATVDQKGSSMEIQGRFLPASDIIDAGNSGQVLRFMGAIAALLPSYTEITGDASIRRLRPVKPLLKALRSLGALAESARGDGYAPILMRGPIKPGYCRLSGEDSQPVSALLMATSFLDGPSTIEVESPGETPWIDLTLSWLRRFGASVEHENYKHYEVKGGLSYSGFSFSVPGDFSTAAFPLCAALATKSPLHIHGLDPQEVQGDRVLIELLQEMGAQIHWEQKTLCIAPTESLQGIDIDINRCIDALPVLAVVGCFAKGTTRLYNGSIARSKESNRIDSIAIELRKMGAHIKTFEDGLLIESSPLHGAELYSHNDHRIALALSVAALGASSPSFIQGAHCIDKSYPGFVQAFQSIGASIELDPLRV